MCLGFLAALSCLMPADASFVRFQQSGAQIVARISYSVNRDNVLGLTAPLRFCFAILAADLAAGSSVSPEIPDIC